MMKGLAGLAPALMLMIFCRADAASSNPAVSPLGALISLLREIDDPAVHRDVLRGVQEAIAGRRDMPMPAGWPDAYRKLADSPEAEVRERATVLAVVFGDPQALASLRRRVLDSGAAATERERAIQTLVQKRDRELPSMLHRLVADGAVRGPVLRGLSAFDDEMTPAVILKSYASLAETEKQDAINTLASRPAYAWALLEAVENEQVPRRDLSAYTVRQLAGLNDQKLSEKLEQVWGTIRPAAQDKTALISQYKRQLNPETLIKADLSRGRLAYSRTCAACHKLFDDGRQVGPELTGSQRHNLDYVLENLLDPSAVVGRDYQMSVIVTTDGRVITGIIQQESDQAVTVATNNDTVIVPSNEIEERNRSPVSMMPEGILNNLTPEEVRDLIGYLASPAQVPLPEEE